MPSETEDSNLKKIANNMSEINPDVIKIQNEEKKSESSWPERAVLGDSLRDKRGRTFDPAIHDVDNEGAPKINREGFLSIKAGRPSKTGKIRSEKQFNAQPAANEKQTEREEVKAALQNQNMAKITTAFFIKLGVGVFGEEWYPQKFTIQEIGITVDEEVEMVNSFDAYFKSRGITDLTPGWALVLALSGYAAARMTKPKTQSRLKTISQKVGEWSIKFYFRFKDFFKKAIKGVSSATHANHRNDGERQDNASAQTSGRVPA